MLYLGDEVAVLNRYEYEKDPAQAGDSRWVHRSIWSDRLSTGRSDPSTPEGRVFQALSLLAKLRRENPVFGVQAVTVNTNPFPSVLSYFKVLGTVRLTLVANFAEHDVALDSGIFSGMLGGRDGLDLVSGEPIRLRGELVLGPCALVLILS